MDKRVTIVLLCVVSLLGISSIANASVTPGERCQKVGIKHTYKGKIFTCIKLGSKKYWNNGAKVNSKKQSVAPAPAKIPTSLEVAIIFTGGEISFSSWGDGLSKLYCSIPASAPVQPMFPNYSVSGVDWSQTNLKVFDGTGKLMGVASTRPTFQNLDNGDCSATFTLSQLVLNQGPLVFQTGSNPKWTVNFDSWSTGKVRLNGDKTVIRYG